MVCLCGVAIGTIYSNQPDRKLWWHLESIADENNDSYSLIW